MPHYQQLSQQQLVTLRDQTLNRYTEFQSQGIKLDMSRGKPSTAQLDLCMDMLDILSSRTSIYTAGGLDIRNYGVLDGIPEAKKLFADLLGVSADEVIVGGNASLNMMYDAISRAVNFGVAGFEKPWSSCEKIKFLCPTPGYDRHFAITELFGFEMINIKMNLDGPDMDTIERLIAEDDAIKGIWCVPKYSNPQGITYSDAVVKRFAALKPAAKDFRIFWDNAYLVHDLYPEKPDSLLNILDECKKQNSEDMVYIFTSTSKISFSGSGLGIMAASKANIEQTKKYMSIQTIGYDKVNQFQHAYYFKDVNGIMEHMKKHADIVRPKFEAVLGILDRELADTGIGSWNSPSGGYFVSFDSLEGCAKDIVKLCKEAGLVMTGAGATYPYGKDPLDTNIRIAPTYPTLAELTTAMELFCICVKLVTLQKLIK